MWPCSNFVPTSSNKHRCHLCLCLDVEHPGDDDVRYWTDWLIFQILLELGDTWGS